MTTRCKKCGGNYLLVDSKDEYCPVWEHQCSGLKLTFEVLGPPVPKARPRFNKTTRQVYTPKETKDYERHVGSCSWVVTARNPWIEWPIKEPQQVIVDMEIHHEKSYGSAPDADNVVKAICDGIEGVIYVNDRQAVPRVTRVLYNSHFPKVIVTIEAIEQKRAK